MFLKNTLGKILYEFKDLFRLSGPEYQIALSSRNEYWVINREGILVFRHKNKKECIRFIKLNTRNKLR